MSKTEFEREIQQNLSEQSSQNRFNSITQKQKPENQNQQHNVRKEGVTPVNQKR